MKDFFDEIDILLKRLWVLPSAILLQSHACFLLPSKQCSGKAAQGLLFGH